MIFHCKNKLVFPFNALIFLFLQSQYLNTCRYDILLLVGTFFRASTKYLTVIYFSKKTCYRYTLEVLQDHAKKYLYFSYFSLKTLLKYQRLQFPLRFNYICLRKNGVSKSLCKRVHENIIRGLIARLTSKSDDCFSQYLISSP